MRTLIKLTAMAVMFLYIMVHIIEAPVEMIEKSKAEQCEMYQGILENTGDCNISDSKYFG